VADQSEAIEVEGFRPGQHRRRKLTESETA
jgi:hypothetical protein